MEETKKKVTMEEVKEEQATPKDPRKLTGAVRMLVPTKVETTLTTSQLWNGLFSALFGTPHDIYEQTGVDISDMYLVDFTAEDGGLKVCYSKERKREIFDERGKIWRNMLKIGNEIFPGADMDISVKSCMEGEPLCSKEEDTSSEKQ